MVRETELYEVLQVSVEADEHEIKRSYRKLALKYHPDKNTGDASAADMFKKVSNAYEVLSDPEKRQLYDKYGKKGLEGGAGKGGGFHDASDIFSMFFGGGARERGEPKPKDIVHELEVKLDDLYNGATQKVMISRDRFCGACGGTGVKAGAQRNTCAQCRGRGALLRTQQIFPGFHQQVQVQCPSCNGEGETVSAADVCKGCRGKRTVREKTVLEVHIERGAHKTEHFTFTEEGNQEPGLRLAGDVLIFLSVKPHPVFHRVNDHLVMRCPITLQEALCGFELPLEHLDGRTLTVKASPGQVVHGNSAWSVYNEGMPIKGTGGLQRGKLFVCFDVEWPETLPREQVDQIAKALHAPEKLGKLGGQVVELSEYRSKAKAGGKRRGGKKGNGARGAAAGRGGRRPSARAEEEDEFEDVTDDEMEDDEQQQQQRYFRGGAPNFGGNAQTVECSQQ
ncbi:putative DnaJ protein [Leptomonas pyrrhocoris]|uniref:Putative DnaJ protein n=1 Tax=Leptomonas pyrrhocoris TaxID=157538 RepID=A0A0M9FXV4_LEPPY|nr:putative DnaJ protein [Leptomonas pyrrhocoris]KPA78167.1 putative DnaJ protein [Leptomonas pyrrhocoris]|eukprot:XP_015656606.1 putative DnaJ protein [Leptomonas pyrrhocoris]